jgi:hypothetical protein
METLPSESAFSVAFDEAGDYYYYYYYYYEWSLHPQTIAAR